MSAELPAVAPNYGSYDEEFWAATGEGRLLLRRCDECRSYIWYPRPFCPFCGSLRTSWEEASGRGSVYTFTIVHQNAPPPYRAAVPYVVAYIELVEGPRILSNVVGCPPDEVRIGLPVDVVFHDCGNGSALFRFQPAPLGDA